MSFSDYAIEKMVDLYDHHEDQVGEVYVGRGVEPYKSRQPVGCIKYVEMVLSFAYERSGDAEWSKKVSAILKKNQQRGIPLAKTLVKEDGWKGIYYNPDTHHHYDKQKWNDEAAEVMKKYRKSHEYYHVPIHAEVLDYEPDSITLSQVPHIAITEFKLWRLKFGFGCTYGGYHTWLFSCGDVYEIHQSNPTETLYEKSDFTKFTTRSGISDMEWVRSGVIVVPPDAWQASLF